MLNFVNDLKGVTTLLDSDSDRERYRVAGLLPNSVAVPADEIEVAAALRIAAQRGAVVIPRGAGSKGDLGNTPERVDLVLSLERLNQVVEYVPEDMTITVQAGMRYAELQTLVARHGQTAALDPARWSDATVGGIVATAGSGPTRLAHGSVRDILLGTRVAMTDGKVVKTGGRVVKNVAGYDMNKLIVGSLGTLGVITEVSLKLRPLPPASQTHRLGYCDLASAIGAAEGVLNSEMLPLAITVLTDGVVTRLGGPGPFQLAVWLAETRPNLRYQSQRLQALAAGASGEYHLTGEAESQFWEGVRNYGDLSGAPLRIKVNTVIADVANQLGQQADFDGIAHVGTGTVMLYGREDGAGAAGLGEAANEIFERAAEAGGSAVVEAAPPDVKRMIDVWGPQRPEFKLLQAIKRTFDPDAILNRGRYVGGI